MDFKDLNKACPEDSYALPRIDQLVDSTSGHELFSFMDAFSGNNQILMNPADQEGASYITERGLCGYRVMSFGLKNTRATYKRLVNLMFADQISRNIEVYVDDTLTKSKKAVEHLKDLSETFEVLRRFNMKLNPPSVRLGY